MGLRTSSRCRSSGTVASSPAPTAPWPSKPASSSRPSVRLTCRPHRFVAALVHPPARRGTFGRVGDVHDVVSHGGRFRPLRSQGECQRMGGGGNELMGMR
ncbi:unnamed protein product [Ectocarpus sp. 12 AP-2014]